MFTTLIRHEILRTRKWLAIIFGAATLLTLVGTLIAYTPWKIVQVLGLLLAVVAVGAFLYVVQVALAFDYWRSSYSRTGYFTQAIPAKGSAIYGAKLLWGSIATVVALLWTVLLIVPVVFAGAHATEEELTWVRFVDGLKTGFAAAPAGVWTLLVLAVIVLAVGGLAQFYFAASIGSESRINRLGIGGPILVYFGLYLILQVLLFVGIVAIPFGLLVSSGGNGLELVSVDFLDQIATGANSDVVPIGFLPVLLLTMGLLIWRTVVSWNRKISLA